MGEIWAIILAAGESKRMGSPKMLLPVNGMTMIENVVINVSESKVDKILIVLGAESDSIKKVTDEYCITYCYNDNYKAGMLSSVQCGLRNLPSDFSAVLVFQGDQPFIKASVINEVIGEYISTGKGMVIPVFNGKRGHPLLVDRKYNEEIFKLSVDRGLRELTFKFPEDVSEVNTNEPDILRDLDTHKQYLKIINQIK